MDRQRRQARNLRNAPTDAERLPWQCLRRDQLGDYRFRRQVPIDRYIVDFVCLHTWLVVEIDGGQHADEQREYDAQRTKRLQALGYRVLRYWNHDVMQKVGEVLDDILRRLPPPQASPEKWAQGRGASADAMTGMLGTDQQ